MLESTLIPQSRSSEYSPNQTNPIILLAALRVNHATQSTQGQNRLGYLSGPTVQAEWKPGGKVCRVARPHYYFWRITDHPAALLCRCPVLLFTTGAALMIARPPPTLGVYVCACVFALQLQQQTAPDLNHTQAELEVRAESHQHPLFHLRCSNFWIASYPRHCNILPSRRNSAPLNT